jgi:hypothetical protein
MLVQKVAHKSFNVLGLVILLISINQQQAPTIVEAQNSGWSTPQTIPGYDPGTWPPILVADQDRTVHAFSSQPVQVGEGESAQAISYNRWTLEQGWTLPTDIILSPYKDARITDARLDRHGVFHVVFFGGDNTGANIYYSKAPAANANDSQAWSVPIIIGENAGDPAAAVSFEGDPGTLYVIFSGRQPQHGLYVANSKDDGQNWSEPTPVFLTTSDKSNIDDLEVIRGQSGWLHAIWGVYDVGGQGRGIYYARSKDGNEWSEPALLAAASEGLGTQKPTLIEYNHTLISLFIMPPKITMRRSIDNGETWDNPSIIFPRHVGVNGSLSLVIDGNNDLHLFFGQRITGNPDIHGMWHSTYRDNRWTEPDAIIEGPQVTDVVNHKSFDPFQARAIVSQGNTLLATWRTDPGLDGNGVWFSYKSLNIPKLPVSQPATQPPQIVTLTSTPSAENNHPNNMATETPDRNGSLLFEKTPPPKVRNFGSVLAPGILSAVILILVVIGITRNRM